MSTESPVTVSFTMDRALYNQYKSVVVSHGENVKNNLINYMRSTIEYETPNPVTIQAIKEVEQLKNDNTKKTYTSFSEFLEELEDE